MANLITSIFGKSEGITKEDIERVISDKVPESAYLEYKDWRDIQQAKSNDQKLALIIKPLVGFLNSFDGTGVLVVGIAASKRIPERITPIKDSPFTEKQLLARIATNLKSIPKVVHAPQIELRVIPFENNESVILLEITRKEDSAYYSGIDQIVYVRRNDETDGLSLIEALDFIRTKASAKVFLYFDEKPKVDTNEVSFNVGYRNSGLKPGREVLSLVKIITDKNLEFRLEGDSTTDISYINLDATKAYKVHAGYVPSTPLVYPNLPTVLGVLYISSKKDFELLVTVETFESEGKSNQRILITKKDGNFLVKEEGDQRTYQSYLSLRGI